MHGLTTEAAAFGLRKQVQEREAASRVALRLACGIDLACVATASLTERQRIAGRVERAVHRERLKALNRHWSYDLNRHIALRQARDILNGSIEL